MMSFSGVWGHIPGVATVVRICGVRLGHLRLPLGALTLPSLPRRQVF